MVFIHKWHDHLYRKSDGVYIYGYLLELISKFNKVGRSEIDIVATNNWKLKSK